MARKKFFIPQVELEETEIQEVEELEQEEDVNPPKPKYEPEGFVSSIYGKNVKDNAYFHGVKYNNNARQYDIFRDRDKRVNNDDFKDYIIPKENEIYNEEPENENFNGENYENKANEFYYNNPNDNMNREANNMNNQVNNMNNQVNNMNNPYYNNPNPNQNFNNQPFNPNYNQGYNPNPNFNNGYNPNFNNGYNQEMYNNPYNNGYNPNPYMNNVNNVNNMNNMNNQGYNPNPNMNPNYNYNNPGYNSNYNENVNNNNVYNTRGYEEPSFNQDTNDEVIKNNESPIETIGKEVKFKNKKKAKYVAPPLNVLRIKSKDQVEDFTEVEKQKQIINNTLSQFGIGGHVVNYTKGPTVTQFEVQLDDGIKFQKISGIQINLQANLRATSLRMEIPIPGKATIGIEVPSPKREMVFFGDMISDKKFLNDGNPMNVVLGVNIAGDPVYLDISKMPHGLIAGTTGSGKSVCINAIIATILYKAHPDDVKLILVDPKRVEFARYQGIPHLATPIITEPKMANAALQWAVEEMENRYRLFEATGVTQYKEYLQEEKTDARLKHIPYLVIIIDELADLMATTGAEVDESILRITQKARAAGIHLIVATQRPSVDIISGTIKNNIPTKIAFRVGKALDSNIILDHAGAEKLLGNGDMLYTNEMGVENRIQGAFISNSEIKEVVSSLENYERGEYLFTEEDLKKKTIVDHSDDALSDELFNDIARYVVENNTASINYLQKKFSCGFSRIQAIIVKLGELGVVSENLGSRAREVLVNSAELEEILKNINAI